VRHHDLVVIGTGSGNSIVDERFSHLDVAFVEHGVFGGTCLNVGCIPTKMYVYAADVAQAVRHAGRYGVDATVDKVRWTDIRDRVFGRIDPISEGGREYRADRSPNVTLYEGHARFTGPKELAVARTDGSGTDAFSADRIVLAAGSRPVIPDVVTESGVPYETSDTVMRIDELPQRLVILGSGFVAVEFAHVFESFGVEVTIVGRSPLLRRFDHDIRTRFQELVRDRWHVCTDVTPSSVSTSGGGITVGLSDGSAVSGDRLLVATGRVPNGDRLNLAAAGVSARPNGRIDVDAYQRTSAPGVWAMGDASSEGQLKHLANHEERVGAHNLAHPDRMIPSDRRFVPSAVFTHPQIASVGLTEEQAMLAGRQYVSALQTYGSTAYGWAMEDTTSVCKLLADPFSRTLIGAHIMGDQASTLIQPLIQAMSFGLPVPQMASGQYWIHPALTEVVENALLALPL
jgi:mycothione reductase